MSVALVKPDEVVIPDFHTHLLQQKQAFLDDPMPDYQTRKARLDKLYNAIVSNKQVLLDAISDDFGNRSEAETILGEFVPLLDGIKYYKKNLRSWMKTQRRHVPITAAPAEVKVFYQPLGVVGIVAPWNFPVFLALSPLVGALAAGNRAMIKMSELAPITASTVEAIINNAFDPTEVKVFTGEVEAAVEFTKQPYDHLVYTGSTQVGKSVMHAAAENLTPVTLELGGKSPAIIHEDFPMKEAAKRLAFGKSLNAGQVCVSPDYILCPRSKVEEFTSEFIEAVKASYPALQGNADFTSIINERHFSRLKSYLEDAEKKGAQIVSSHNDEENLASERKMPVSLVLNATEDMLVLKEEIFGPILPVIPYDSFDEAISYVNARPRPLALYYFDWDNRRAETVLKKTHSGGVCVNDTMTHVAADDIPFGGIGPSGMGHYHGKEGFLNFSKAKAVVTKGRINSTEFVAPPWGNTMYRGLMKMMKWKHGL